MKKIIPEVVTPNYTWECYLFGLKSTITVFVVKPPCLFWRWMQYLCFGNKWTREEPLRGNEVKK